MPGTAVQAREYTAVVTAISILTCTQSLKAGTVSSTVVVAKLLGAVSSSPAWVAPAHASSRVTGAMIRAIIHAQRQRTVWSCEPKVTPAVSVIIGVTCSSLSPGE